MAALELFTQSLYSDANLVAYYRAENVNDSKGSNNLTNTGSVAFSAAEFNNGFDLGTSNTTKLLDVASNLGVTHLAVTISMWVKIKTQPSNTTQSLCIARTTGGGSNFIDYLINYVDVGGTKTVHFDRSKPGIADQEVSVTNDLGTSLFHHLVLTYDGTNVRGYIDGSLVGSPTGATGVGSGGANHFYIGANSAPSNFASALIDDVAIFTRALSAGEISSLFSYTPVVYTLTLATGSYSLTGFAALFHKTLHLIMSAGSYIYTGQAALLHYIKTLTLDTKNTATFTADSRANDIYPQ